MSATLLPGVLRPWPDPVVIGSRGYKTPDGEFQRVTRFLKVLGLGTDALVKWSANEERKACLEACANVFSEGVEGGPAEFAAAVEARIGPARQHQKILTKAAEIGTSIHEAIHQFLKGELGLPRGPQVALNDTATWALMAFEDWWRSAGLKAVRMEQPVWSPEDGYAGTIDLVAEHPDDGMGVVDFKSSKYIYDEHHLQVAAYMHAGRRHADLRWAKVVRVPKSTADPAFEVKDLGHMYDRVLTEDQLMAAYRAALTVYNLLVAK